jgi:hypothetical protein
VSWLDRRLCDRRVGQIVVKVDDPHVGG